MTTAHADLVVALRARDDLVVQSQVHRRRRTWCIKDPVSLAYFHLNDDEYALFRLLDGRVTLGALCAAFERRVPGAAPAAEALQAFLASLQRSGLVTTETPRSGAALWRRRTLNRRRAVWSALPKLLAIRFRGIDPSPLLRRLDAAFGTLISLPALVAAALLAATAVMFVLLRLDEFRAALPGADAFMTPGNLVVLFGVIGGVKILHELGHALACRRLGGECHELGLMLLVFTPCLYCDVSDSWLFPQKWRRAAVAAAGIIVEIVLASLATFGWWFSEPGLFHAVCMNMMLVGSINTIWLNGNPLLRYDGYFVLSDVLEIPNLAEESRAAVNRLLFGDATGAGRAAANPEGVLIVYGLLSAVYRVLLTFAIAWMILKALSSVNLAPLGYAIAALCVAGLAAGPVFSVVTAFRSPARGRALLVTLIGVTALIAAAWVPLPRRIEAPAVLQPRGAHRVYATVGGRLVDAAPAGAIVAAGDVVGRLDDPELERHVVELAGRRDQLQARLRALESRRLVDPAVAGQLTATRQAVDAVTAQLAARQRNFAGLTLTATAAGTVLPPPSRPKITTAGELPEWSGSPLERRNVGCRIDPGTLFCLVGDPRSVEASLYVAEDLIEAIDVGQRVVVLLDQAAGQTIAGTVAAISADPLRVAPPELARSQQLPVAAEADGSVRPLETIYEVRVTLEESLDGSTLRIRGTGRAKVSAGTASIADRLRRFLRRTFRFEL